jgi:hypothetical protein
MEKVREESMQAAQEQAKSAQEQEAAEKEEASKLTREGHDKDKYIAHVYADNKAMSDNIKANSAEKIKRAELAQKQVEASKPKPTSPSKSSPTKKE